jgi:hypothetical protein
MMFNNGLPLHVDFLPGPTGVCCNREERPEVFSICAFQTVLLSPWEAPSSLRRLHYPPRCRTALIQFNGAMLEARSIQITV